MKIVTWRKVLAFGSLALLLYIGGFLAQDYFRSQRIAVALIPCTEAMRLNPDSGGLPCYQAALHDDPGNQMLQLRVATALVSLGRFTEARPLFQKAEGEFGFERGKAKAMLQPGAMQRWKATMDHFGQVHEEYVALVQQHGREAEEFQATHPTDEEPYKTQMRELVKAHVRQEREMMIAKGIWKPSVLQEPYYSVPKR